MKNHPRLFLACACAALTLAAAPIAPAEDCCPPDDELTCLPVNGYINLPGILYEDLTPLARDKFNGNTAAVTNALYALPMEQRDDFLLLYLQPKARDRHRRFFARCRDVAQVRERATRIGRDEVIPPALRDELLEKERVRLALHDNAMPFRVGDYLVYIPIPLGYASDEVSVSAICSDPSLLGLGCGGTLPPITPPASPNASEAVAVTTDCPPAVPATTPTNCPDLVTPAKPSEKDLVSSLAVFRKIDLATPGQEPLIRRRVLASIRHVRTATDNLKTLLSAYQIMVDPCWRIASVYPPGAAPGQADSVEYKWNLAPFSIKDNSFCYAQFEKTVDFHGVEEIRYRATAILTLPGSYIQVSITHPANTSLELVNEINTDLTRWRDAILMANYN